MGATVVKYLEKMQLIWGVENTGKCSLDSSCDENYRDKVT